MFTLTQPWATVVAAVAVLLAAGVTYLVGVHNRRQAHLHWTGSDRQQRFLDATRQLADDNAAVRIAGVAAIEVLTDDWLADAGNDKQRPRAHQAAQQCVNVLCAYVRIPTASHPSGDANVTRSVVTVDTPGDPETGATTHTEVHREYVAHDDAVRVTILATIAEHCTPDSSGVSWGALSYDLRGTQIPDANFGGAVFSGDYVWFTKSTFTGRTIFDQASFHTQVSFAGATFANGARFTSASFSGRSASFAGAEFPLGAKFDHAQFGSQVQTSFFGAEFGGAVADFSDARFCSGRTLFGEVQMVSGGALFDRAVFAGRLVDFTGATFATEGDTSFRGCVFDAEAEVDFTAASFAAGDGAVCFNDPATWGRVIVPWENSGRVPAGVFPKQWPPEVAPLSG